MAIKLGEAFVNIRILSKQFATQLSKAQAQFQSSIRAMESIAAKAKIGLLIGVGVGAVAVKMAASFEQAMARVQALSGATGRSFQELTDLARELGRTTVFTANQAAEAMSFFALAGFEANKIIGAMPATLNLAAAGQIEVAQAADITAKIMSGMGLTVDELTQTVDVLTKAFTTSNTDLIQLGDAMKFVGPVARSAGKDITEVTAAIQVMSNAGLQGTLAGTALRNILAKLSGGTKTTNDVFKSLGVAMQTSTGDMRPLADVVDDLNASMAKLGEAERLAKLMTAFGLRAGPGMATLLAAGGDALREYEKRLQNAGGTAARIAAIQLDTFIGKWKLMTSALTDTGILLGEKLLPMMTDFVNRIKGWAIALSDLSDEQISNGLHTAAMIAKWALLLIVTTKIMSVMAGMATLLSASGPWGVALIGAAAAIAVLGAAFIKSQTTGEGFIKTLGEMELALLRLDTVTRELAAEEARSAAAAAATQEAIGARATGDLGRGPAIKAAKDAIKIEKEAIEREKEVIAKLRKQVDAATAAAGGGGGAVRRLFNAIVAPGPQGAVRSVVSAVAGPQIDPGFEQKTLDARSRLAGARTRLREAEAALEENEEGLQRRVGAAIRQRASEAGIPSSILDLISTRDPAKVDIQERLRSASKKQEAAVKDQEAVVKEQEADAKVRAGNVRRGIAAVTEARIAVAELNKESGLGGDVVEGSLVDVLAGSPVKNLRLVEETFANIVAEQATAISNLKQARESLRTAQAREPGEGLAGVALAIAVPRVVQGLFESISNVGRTIAGVPGGIAADKAQAKAAADFAKSPVLGAVGNALLGTFSSIARANIDVAAGIAGNAPKAIGDAVKAVEERARPPLRQAEFIGIADFAKTIQTRIGGIDDEAKRQRADMLKAAEEQVALLEGAKGGVLKEQFDFLKANLPLRVGD